MERWNLDRKFAIFGVFVLITTGLAGCLGTTPGDDGDEGPPALKVGSMLPLTGDLSIFGGPAENAVKLAVMQVNENGGVHGKDVTHLSGDTETSQQAAPNAMQQLVNVDGVHGVVGAMSSGVSLSIIDTAVQSGLPMISPASTSPTFTDYDDQGWFMRTVPSDALQGQVMAQLAIDEGHSTASILAVNNDYGAGFADVFEEQFQAETGHLVLQKVLYDPQGTSFDSDVDQAAQGDPDVIVLIGYPDTGTVIMNTAFEKGYAGPNGSVEWLFSEGVKDPGFVDQVGQTEGGEWILAGYKGTTPEFSIGQAFANDYQAEYDAEPALFSDTSFDAAMLLMLAAEACECNGGQSYQDALFNVQNGGTSVSDVGQALDMVRNGQNIDWDGAAGNIDWNDVGDVPQGMYGIWSVSDSGEIVSEESGIQVGS